MNLYDINSRFLFSKYIDRKKIKMDLGLVPVDTMRHEFKVNFRYKF